MNAQEFQVDLDAHMASLHNGIAARFQALAEQLDAHSQQLHLGIAARFEAQAAQLDARAMEIVARLNTAPVSAPASSLGSASLVELLSHMTEKEIDRLDSYLVHHVDDLKFSIARLEGKLDALRELSGKVNKDASTPE